MRKITQKGFTLLELMTAVAIFSIVLMISLGIFSRFTDNSRRNIGEQQIQEDMRLALELFNREVRTGYGETYNFFTDKSGFVFRNQNRKCVVYKLSPSGQFMRAESVFAEPDNNCADPNLYSVDDFESITDSTTVIDKLTFMTKKAELDDGKLTNQGFVTVIINAHTKAKQDNQLHIQNTITSRQINPYTRNEE